MILQLEMHIPDNPMKSGKILTLIFYFDAFCISQEDKVFGVVLSHAIPNHL